MTRSPEEMLLWRFIALARRIRHRERGKMTACFRKRRPKDPTLESYMAEYRHKRRFSGKRGRSAAFDGWTMLSEVEKIYSQQRNVEAFWNLPRFHRSILGCPDSRNENDPHGGQSFENLQRIIEDG